MKRLFRSALLAGLTLVASAPMAEPVNVNTATAEEIAQSLNGVGDQKARAIVEYREAHGPFKSAQELTAVKGIGEKTVVMNQKDILL
jgi:competence protein ComEA